MHLRHDCLEIFSSQTHAMNSTRWNFGCQWLLCNQISVEIYFYNNLQNIGIITMFKRVWVQWVRYFKTRLKFIIMLMLLIKILSFCKVKIFFGLSRPTYVSQDIQTLWIFLFIRFFFWLELPQSEQKFNCNNCSVENAWMKKNTTKATAKTMALKCTVVQYWISAAGSVSFCSD